MSHPLGSIDTESLCERNTEGKEGEEGEEETEEKEEGKPEVKIPGFNSGPVCTGGRSISRAPVSIWNWPVPVTGQGQESKNEEEEEEEEKKKKEVVEKTKEKKEEKAEEKKKKEEPNAPGSARKLRGR